MPEPVDVIGEESRAYNAREGRNNARVVHKARESPCSVLRMRFNDDGGTCFFSRAQLTGMVPHMHQGRALAQPVRSVVRWRQEAKRKAFSRGLRRGRSGGERVATSGRRRQRRVAKWSEWWGQSR